MDRQLRVMKDGYLFAEMTFNYDSQTSGNVSVALYATIDLAEIDSKSVYPLSRFAVPFQHKEISSMEEVVKHDTALLLEHSEPSAGNLEFLYEPLDYRYVLGDPMTALIGIADIQVNFTDNIKEFRFISSRNMNEDFAVSTNALEYNVGFIKRTFHERLSELLMELKQVNLN